MPAFSLAADQGRFAAFLLLTFATCYARGEDWLPISPEELSMRSAPKAPNAPAIYLYRQVDRDDNDPSESTYERIKILTEEGRDNANIEIPYLKGSENILSVPPAKADELKLLFRKIAEDEWNSAVLKRLKP